MPFRYNSAGGTQEEHGELLGALQLLNPHEEWREIAGAGIAHEQSQNNEQNDRRRQQTTAGPHVITIIRHEVRQNPAPRRDIRPKL